MAPKLTVQNAEIKTAAVELKTLTVSGKQVTLAVFRQLKDTNLLRWNGSLNGVPWGTVNYHPDKVWDHDSGGHWGSGPQKMISCDQMATHLHVVWQEGIELRRSLVWNPEWCAKHYADWGGQDDPERITYVASWHALLDLPQLFIAV